MKITRLLTATLLIGLLFSLTPPHMAQSSPPARPHAGLNTNAFGYTVEAGLDFASNWVDIQTTGTRITFSNSDDGLSGAINAGFPLLFFEHPVSTIYVTTNGFLTAGEVEPNPVKKNAPIPIDDEPNEIVAPFWDDLILVTTNYDRGKVYYMIGGSAPNRFLIVEWVEVLRYGTGTGMPLTFEAILHENGDVIFNYHTLSGSLESATVGIEDADGVDGVQFLYNEAGLSSSYSVAFRYPFNGPRLKAFPLYRGQFLSDQSVDFSVTINNTGTVQDTYDLSTEIIEGDLAAELSFLYPLTFQPLTDTDGDDMPDTGPVAPGTGAEILLRVIAGSGAPVGEHLFIKVIGTSSVDTSKQFAVQRDTAVPAQFAHAINNTQSGTNVLFSLPSNQVLEQPTLTTLTTIPALVRVSRYVYLLGWERQVSGTSNIEYLLLDYLTRYISPLYTIRDNSGGSLEKWRDIAPVITNTSNGKIGVLFIRKKVHLSWGTNDNVVFALLDAEGNLVRETEITHNTNYGFSNVAGTDFFGSPALAATDGNKFILAWVTTRWVEVNETEIKPVVDIYTAVLDENGAMITEPTLITESQVDNRQYHEPVLASTIDGGAYMVFSAYNDALQQYQLGDIKFDSSLEEEYRGLVDNWTGCKPDVLQLKSGNILLAWSNLETNQISYSIALTMEQPYSYTGVHDLNTPTGLTADYVSVTQDPNGNGVMTWGDRQKDFLFYSLVTPLGDTITPPMMFNYGIIPDASLFFNGNMASAPLDGTVKNVIPLIGW